MSFGDTLQRFDQVRHTPGLEERAMRALVRGVKPKDVAEVYGVNVRTAYRWRRDLVAVESVQVGGWVATFVTRRGRPPARISEWTAS